MIICELCKKVIDVENPDDTELDVCDSCYVPQYNDAEKSPLKAMLRIKDSLSWNSQEIGDSIPDD